MAERLAIGAASLPKGISVAPFMLPPLSATSRAMKIGVKSDQYSVTDLSMLVYWNMRWKMMTVPGVANVVMWGERLKQLQVQVNPEVMRAYDVPLTEIEAAAAGALDTGLFPFQRSAKSQVPGFIDTPNQRLGIQHELPGRTVEDSPQEFSKIAISTLGAGTTPAGRAEKARRHASHSRRRCGG